MLLANRAGGTTSARQLRIEILHRADHDNDVGMSSGDRAADLDPACVWHPLVNDHNLRRVLLDELQRLVARGASPASWKSRAAVTTSRITALNDAWSSTTDTDTSMSPVMSVPWSAPVGGLLRSPALKAGIPGYNAGEFYATSAANRR